MFEISMRNANGLNGRFYSFKMCIKTIYQRDFNLFIIINQLLNRSHPFISQLSIKSTVNIFNIISITPIHSNNNYYLQNHVAPIIPCLLNFLLSATVSTP